MVDEEYEDDEDMEDEYDLSYEDAGHVEYTMCFFGAKGTVKKACAFAREIRPEACCSAREDTIYFEEPLFGGLVAYDDGADDAPVKIIEKLADKVAKKYPSVRFVIYGKTQFEINEGNYGPGGVVVYPPTWYRDFHIEFRNKKLTYRTSDDYESLHDARDDVEEGIDFEGCGPLSEEELHEIFQRNGDGSEFWYSRGSIFEDEVPLGTPIEYKIDWDKKD